MTLAPGTRLGPYEILSPLGAGGMGEVYRARDTRLERTVAIKVLSPQLSASPESRQRFEREARTISQLSHPHICALYDVGHQDGTDYLVMEYLEGETLGDRLAKMTIPLEHTLRFGVQIADALDKAHRQGIVHRDLKPGNVMLTKSGVKLLDFGLAKAMAPAAPASSLTALPTQQGLTQEGTILGTFQYMAPEQLEGKEADARTDIFAFGAVLYEMATGRKAFSGTSQASLIGAILHTDPAPISSLQPATPPALDRIVKTCLAKDPEERWQSAADVKRELRWIAEGGSQVGLPDAVVSRRKSRERLLWIPITALLALAAALPWAIRSSGRAPPGVRPMRFVVMPPEKAIFTEEPPPAGIVSPDGHHIAFVASSAAGAQLWVRALDSLTALALPGTEGASYPFWSPDSRFIAFFAGGRLKKIELSGKSPQILCDAFDPVGGTWNREGTIVFSRGFSGEPLYRVPASGGTPAPVTRLDQSRREDSHRWPHFLPDGRHFLYLASISTRQANNAIYVGSLDSKETKHLVTANSNAAYAPPGFLLFVSNDTLMAQPFDPDSLVLKGDAVPIAERVEPNLAGAFASFSVSENGVLTHWSGTAQRELVWFDRAGSRLGALGGASDYTSPSLSPDEKRVAVARSDSHTGSSDIWLIEVARGIQTRLTSYRTEEAFPIWSPDGGGILFISNRDGPEDLYQRVFSRADADEALHKSSVAHKHPMDWSRDGRFILYQTRQARTGSDLWVLPLSGDRQPFPLLQTEFGEWHGQISPDGRHVAYTSDESGAWEVYVQPFPGSGERLRISASGGEQPRWRRDGNELFYIAADGTMMAVPLDRQSGSLNAGIPKALFKTAVHAPSRVLFTYVVTGDGQRFLINTSATDALRTPLTVVLNWTAELKR